MAIWFAMVQHEHNMVRYVVFCRVVLTHWGRVTHICVGKLTTTGSDNDLSPGRRQAIIWTNAGILLIGPWGTNFSEILIGIQTFSFKKMRLKMSSVKWRPFCLGLNVLNGIVYHKQHSIAYLISVPWDSQRQHSTQHSVACRGMRCIEVEWGRVEWSRAGRTELLRKSKDFVYGIWVYKVLGSLWKGYYRVKITSFMH